MENSINAILNRLLDIEHLNVMYRIGFLKKQPNKPSFDDVCDSVKALNELSLGASEAERNTFITIAALLWEYSSYDYPNLKDYILDQYNRFIEEKPLKYNPNMEYIEQYNYKNLAKLFTNIIEDLTSNRSNKFND